VKRALEFSASAREHHSTPVDFSDCNNMRNILVDKWRAIRHLLLIFR